jgi:Fur family transcriptional regulator, ferric uptake regulator
MNQDAAREVLQKYLKTQGKLRSTPARMAVLDAISQTQGHFDAESLYYRLVSNGTKISRATVYNTLDLLQDCGLVSKYRFAESSSRYEKAFGRPHHHHLICLHCGDILEFVNERLNRLQEDVCGSKEFTPHSSSLQIFGTCAKCAKTRSTERNT